MGETKIRSFCASRLVNLLSDPNPTDIGTHRDNFAEKLGQMFHLAGTVKLAAVLENPSPGRFSPSGLSAGAIRETFLAEQKDLVRFIAKSFLSTSARIRDRLPNADALHAHCCLAGIFPRDPGEKSKPRAAVFEPYRKFYEGRQRMLDIKVRHVRSRTRDMISGLSPELARLARLDKTLEESLSGVPAQSFASIPKLLEKRFNRLLDNHWHEISDNPEPKDLEPWMVPGGWISAFCGDMRELLFAELEVRLQPVSGMIDTLPLPFAANARPI